MGYATFEFEPPVRDGCPYCEDPNCPAEIELDCPDYQYEKSTRDGEYEDENPEAYDQD